MYSRTHTNWTKLGVILSNTFHSMQLHLNLLARSQFCKNDVRVCWSRRTGSKYFFLFTRWMPSDMRGKQFMINVRHLWVRRTFWRFRVAKAGHVYFEDQSVAVGRLIIRAY